MNGEHSPEQAPRIVDAGLTPREVECLRLLASGLRMRDLAGVLGLAEKTVEKHVASARKRLKAATRDHAVAIAIREGLI